MSSRLVAPQEAAEQVARALARRWADAVCAERGADEPFHVIVALSPGVVTGAHAAAWGFDVRHGWTTSWREVSSRAIPGVEVRDRTVSVGRVREPLPATLVVTGLDAAVALIRGVGVELPAPDVGRARRVAAPESVKYPRVVLEKRRRRVAMRLPGCVRSRVRGIAWCDSGQ